MSPAEDEVEARLAALDRLDAPALRAEWAKAFGRPAPARLGRDLLARALACRIQEQAWGGLQPAAGRRLQRLAAALQKGEPMSSEPPSRLAPGVRLMREWNGETHVVDVLERGFAWRGATHRSLSAIARAITGTRWSGPRFFGLVAPATAGSGASAEP